MFTSVYEVLCTICFMFLKDELLAELAELEQEELEQSMKNMDRLPSAPTTKLPSTRPSHHASKYAKKPSKRPIRPAYTVCASSKCLSIHSFSLQEESGG